MNKNLEPKHVAAWPLFYKYPGARVQTGLTGTWMNAFLPEPKPIESYSTIEGGLGRWDDTVFGTETPKFPMGGVAVDFRQVSRALRGAVAAALVIGLLGCGSGGGGDADQTANTASASTPPAPIPVAVLPAPAPAPGPTPEPATVTTPSPASAPAPALSKTQVALDEFWGRYGAKSSFDQDWVELLTKLLDAEDKVAAEDFKGARLIVDELIKKYPLMDNNTPGGNAWWINYSKMYLRNPRPHFGEPGLYAHLRMLDDITKMGVSKTLLGKTILRMAIVMPTCTDIVPESGPTLTNERLSPEIEANDFAVVRQSLRLFQSYLLAISGGELRLELKFYKIEKCLQIKPETRYLLGSFTTPLDQLPEGEAKKADMFWLIYPNHFDKGAEITFKGGMSSYDSGKPLFMSEDDWIIKKRAPQQGSGSRTEVERRMYLPEWVQHEFFHHLMSSWKQELGLPNTDKEWADNRTWPADFTGILEEDFFSEALNKRLYKATPSIAQKLQLATK